jgi:hypothetical protein
MIDRPEDPEDKAQWREPANREPPEFDPYVEVMRGTETLSPLFVTLEFYGFSREEAKEIIEEVIKNEF